MNILHLKHLGSENISLHKPQPNGDNGVLSQILLAVTPNCLNWLFLRLNTTKGAGANPSYINYAQRVDYPFMVWLILQNKPIGEYVKRLLFVPRVKPHRPFLGCLTQKTKGVFTMNTKQSSNGALNTIQSNHIPNENISLHKPQPNGNNTATTKTLLAVKPSRHSLAIFTPIIGVIRHIKPKGLLVYGGLIEPNITPQTGNKFSRLVAVVETRQPYQGLASSLTKLLGVFA
ncbi:MAG: hypothetical protein D8B60_05920 [Moraxella sp.]|nr:MAG: hypothetical protein D8B60_05920 [Moraxella sp.]